MAESLNAFSERALRAVYTGELIPPIVYIPAKLRKGKQRLTAQGIVTTNPKTPEEVEAQIAAADPAGMLIAIMQGQPIPTFRVKAHGASYQIETDFQVADLALRAEVAWRLSQRQRARRLHEDPGYEARIKEAAAAYQGDE